jgi:hypothetical protein
MRARKTLDTPEFRTDTSTSSDRCRPAVPSDVHGCDTSVRENLSALFFGQ